MWFVKGTTATRSPSLVATCVQVPQQNSLDIHACVCDTDQVYKNGLRANSAELSQEFGLCGQFASRNRIKECMNQSKES